MMNPDDMDDAQMMRLVTVGIAALSGINSTPGGLIRVAEILARYIETGEKPE